MDVTNQNAPETVADKGKGKIIRDESMTEDDEDDEEEEEEEDEDEEMAEVRSIALLCCIYARRPDAFY